MMEGAVRILTAIACLIVLARTEPALNRMCGATDLFVRVSFWQMAVAASIELLSILFYGYAPGWRECLLSSGLALLLLCERRIRMLTRIARRRTDP